eukprot:362843_1
MTESKSQDIPSSARVWESAVLNIDVATVWAAVRAVTFEFSSAVKSTKVIGNVDAVGSSRSISYADGANQTVQIMELSDLRRSVTYSVTESTPAVSYTSATHQITLREVTNPSDAKAQTFIEWTSDFSNDAKIQVIEDSRYKKRTAFKDMAKFLATKK